MSSANSRNQFGGYESPALDFGRVLFKSIFTYIAGSHEAKMNLPEHVYEVLQVMTTETVKDGEGFKGNLQWDMTDYPSHLQMQESELAHVTDELNEVGADALAKERELEEIMTRFEEVKREKERAEISYAVAKQKAVFFAERQDEKVEDIEKNKTDIGKVEAKSLVHSVYGGGLEEVASINFFGANISAEEIRALLEKGAGSENSLLESFRNLTRVELIKFRRFIKNAGVESHPAHEGNIKITLYPHRSGSTRVPDQLTPDLAWETYDVYLPQVASSANVDETANNHSMPPTKRASKKRKTDFDSIASERFNSDVVEEFASPMRMKRIKLGKESANRRRLFSSSLLSTSTLDPSPGTPNRTGTLAAPSTPSSVSGTRASASFMTPVPAANINCANDKSSGKHSLMCGGIDSSYDAVVLERLNPIAETEDGMLDALGSPMIDDLD